MQRNDYGKILGDVETQIMDIVWESQKPIAVSDVAARLQKKRTIAYTTVMTIMGRLARKGLLKRNREGKAYLYRPTYSKDVFLARISRQFITNLSKTFGETAITHFAQELNNIPSKKKTKLVELLEQAKKS